MNAIKSLAQGCSRQLVSRWGHGLQQALPAVATSHYCCPQQTQTQVRCISKYISKSAKKRIPLTTKRAGKGYYKGKGGTKEGRLNSKGRFIVDPKRKLELVVPDLEGFQLKPYIARTASKVAPEMRRRPGQV